MSRKRRHPHLLPTPSDHPTEGGEQPLAAHRPVGQQANDYAARGLFEGYRMRRAAQTLRRHDTDLASFSDFLTHLMGDSAPTGEALATLPEAWQGITWGLVEGFVRWLIAEGYAIATVNARLSTVRIYARLAHQAGALPEQEYQRLRDVKGYREREAREINQQRKRTRRGAKKANPVRLTLQDARALKAQPETPQGHRDRLLLCLLLDHGLRVSEVADLQVDDLEIEQGRLVFYRRKVDRTQTHHLSEDTLRAARAYRPYLPPSGDPLLRTSRKDGSLRKAGMSTRALTARVRVLGKRIGLHKLSAHDCRHYWATNAARAGTDAFALRDAGGWASLAMPSRYVERATIANQKVKLDT